MGRLKISQLPVASSIVDAVVPIVQDGETRQADASLFGGGGSLNVPLGQCRLAKVSTNLVLAPFGGRRLFIDGALETIPSAGVSLSPSGLASSTLYYIYAYMDSGTMTLEASATAPAADSTYGHQIKTGDATRTLVGMARTDGSTAWVDTAAQRFVLSYFNRRSIGMVNFFTANRSTTSTSFVEVNSEIRCEFLAWGDDAVSASAVGIVYNNNATAFCATGLAFDGTTPEEPMTAATVAGASYYTPFSVTVHKSGLSAGYHYATLLGRVNNNTGTWVGGASGTLHCTVNVELHG